MPALRSGWGEDSSYTKDNFCFERLIPYERRRSPRMKETLKRKVEKVDIRHKKYY